MKIYNINEQYKEREEEYMLLSFGVIGLGLGIYFLIVKNFAYGIVLVALSSLLILFNCFKIIQRKMKKNKNSTIVKIENDVNSKELINKLVQLGFNQEMIDCINKKDRIEFGVLYDNTCYYNARINRINKTYAFGIELVNEISKDIKIINYVNSNKSLKDKIKNYKVYQIDNYTNYDIYKWFKEFTVKRNNDIKIISEEIQKVKREI